MSRLHARTAVALARKVGDRWELASPSPGWFVPAVGTRELITRGRVLGTLSVLGRDTQILAPDVQGLVTKATYPGPGALAFDTLDARPVSFGDPLAILDTAALLAGADATTVSSGDASTPATSAGLVFPAPTSGRFYGRSAPDKPPFVTAGAELAHGGTVCLLEVMKTFHRVTYGGATLPERVRVREVLVADGADVNAGDPLLALDPV